MSDVCAPTQARKETARATATVPTLCSLPIDKWKIRTPPAAISSTGEKSRRALSIGGLQMSGVGEFSHRSVMADEVVAVLSDVPHGWVIDATLGGGGHAQALLEANPALRVLGIDQDQMALAAASARLADAGDRFRSCHARFDALATAVDTHQVQPVVGVLFDLGVSSPQLDRAERGFSYRHDGPLDMRMNQDAGETAAELINRLDERALMALLVKNADERHARRIARAIIAHRPFKSTAELAAVVADAVPAAVRRTGGHPARKTFQALRIAVNQELDILEGALRTALDLLVAGGRCAVLAYHSGEDRIVKQVFREAAGDVPRPRADLPPPPGTEASVTLLWRGAKRPSDSEVDDNPRAEAARFRAVEKIKGAA